MTEYFWYDPQIDEPVFLKFSLADVIINYAPQINNPLPKISKVEITDRSFDSGRLIHEEGDVLEFIGEL